jgi:uncharacterized membrane protein
MSEGVGGLGVLHIGIGILVIAVAIPFLLGRVPMNRWFGTRLRESYTSEANWYAMNRYGAIQMMWYGGALVVVGIAILCFPPRLGGAWFFAGLAAPGLLTVPMLVMLLRYAKRLPK